MRSTGRVCVCVCVEKRMEVSDISYTDTDTDTDTNTDTDTDTDTDTHTSEHLELFLHRSARLVILGIATAKFRAGFLMLVRVRAAGRDDGEILHISVPHVSMVISCRCYPSKIL